jgi:Cys-rich protein (TIGR01571 family)
MQSPFLDQKATWTFGLCSCCEDPCFVLKMYCCVSPHGVGICCCPFIYATAYEKALQKPFCLSCVLGYCGCLCYREELVKKYNINESRCASFCYSCFCPLCTVVQEVREIELRENGRISTCNARCPPTVFKMHRQDSSHKTHTERFKDQAHDRRAVVAKEQPNSQQHGGQPQTALALPSNQFVSSRCSSCYPLFPSSHFVCVLLLATFISQAVTCPPGCGPGVLVQVKTPQGQLLQVNVPPSITPGQQFMVAY